jgi:hypothetical protein
MRETFGPVLEREWLAQRLQDEDGEKGEPEAIVSSANEDEPAAQERSDDGTCVSVVAG